MAADLKKYFCVIPEKDFATKNEILREMSTLLGLPQIEKRLSIFAHDKKQNEVHIHLDSDAIEIKFKTGSDKRYKLPSNTLKLKNENIKDLFHYINELGYTEATIGEIMRLNFPVQNGVKVIFSEDTFIGDLFVITAQKRKDIKSIEKVLSQRGFKVTRSEKRKPLKQKGRTVHKVTLVDKFGVVNTRITTFADSVGINISSYDLTLQSRIEMHSNDYTDYEYPFNTITDTELLSTSEITNKEILTPPISVVICCYNSEVTIVKTLASINSQNLSDLEMRNLEVVIVDDGSLKPVDRFIKTKKYRFNLRAIRLEQNQGLSAARNIGFSCTNNQNVLFIDSDILLPANYLREISIRVSLIPNAVFVSFKQNIDASSDIASLETIEKGLMVPDHVDDLRISRNINSKKVGITQLSKDTYVELLADSRYFKNLGYGRRIGIYDLPSMVIGHNFALKRKIVEDSNFFSRNFIGWGLEDTYFGARAIANGNFVIPILSTGVYHIDHPPRSGSEKNKQTELITNLQTYKSLLKESLRN